MARFKIDPKSGKVLVYSERTGKWRVERKKKGEDRIATPSVMPDIKEFVANATDKPALITSRSQLARYERSNNIRQCGDHKPGDIIARRKKSVEAGLAEARKLGGGVTVQWT